MQTTQSSALKFNPLPLEAHRAGRLTTADMDKITTVLIFMRMKTAYYDCLYDVNCASYICNFSSHQQGVALCHICYKLQFVFEIILLCWCFGGFFNKEESESKNLQLCFRSITDLIAIYRYLLSEVWLCLDVLFFAWSFLGAKWRECKQS